MSILVEPLWLADRLRDPKTVVLDATLPPVGVIPPVDTRARYVVEHIPGAVFFDIDELSDHSTDLPHMLPSADIFSRQMAQLGVSDSAPIVVYEQESVYSAPRAWWMLRTFGAQEVHLLDGGLRAWREAGLPTRSGEVRRPAAHFVTRPDPGAVISLSQIRQMLSKSAQVVDARSAGRFAGTLPEPRPGLSSGHMPGGISIPFTELVEDGRLKPIDGLREIFKARNLDMEQAITTSCGSGVTAAVGLLGDRKSTRLN